MKQLDIKEIRKIQLDILDTVDKYCSENKISYFMTGGTLLGAVRHKGYIPWDDDVDITMLRKDYNRFINEFNKNGNDDVKVISNIIDTKFPYAFAKIENTSTLLEENVDIKYKIGINIDLFPLENLDDDINKVLNLNKKIAYFRNMLSVKCIKNTKKRKFYKRFILNVGKLLLKIYSYEKIVKNIDSLSQTYISNCNSKYVSVLSVFTYGKGEIIERKVYSDYVLLEFEGKRYRAPVGYDVILTNLYGNYMKLPPKEKQVTHHDYKAYKL